MDNNMDKRRSNDGEIEIDLMQIIKTLLSKAWMIILAGIAAGLLALIATEMLITPLYQSTAKLYIVNRQNDSTTTITDIQSSSQLIKDYQVLVTSIPVIDQVISNLELNLTQDGLIDEIDCTIETDSRVLAITVTDSDPYMAKKIVDAIADVSAVQIPEVMRIEGVNIIEYGRIPSNQSSPNVVRNVLLGVMVGILLSIIVIIVKYLLDDSIKNADDVERYLGMSTLSLIPMTKEEYDGKHSGKRKKSAKRKRG